MYEYSEECILTFLKNQNKEEEKQCMSIVRNVF